MPAGIDDDQLPLAALPARRVAARARVGDHGALAAAPAAGRHLGELSEDALMAPPDLSRAGALEADRRRRSRLASAALAPGANLRAPDLDRALAAEDRLLEVDGQRLLEVSAAPGRRARPSRAAAEEGVEDVAEPAEGIEAVEPLRAVLSEPGVAEAVVRRPLLRVREHLVRLVDLLEALRRALVLVPIRVELERQLPERLLQLLVGAASGDAQDLVVVAFLSSHLAFWHIPSALDYRSPAHTPQAAGRPQGAPGAHHSSPKMDSGSTAGTTITPRPPVNLEPTPATPGPSSFPRRRESIPLTRSPEPSVHPE